LKGNEGAVRSLGEKPLAQQDLEHALTGGRIQLPQTAGLWKGQAQAGHLAIFTANAPNQDIYRRDGRGLLRCAVPALLG
jgi:hypothetical protein